MTSLRRVVITGTGAISALGTGTEKNWQGLLAGKSGVGLISRWDTGKLATKIAAEVKDFNAEDFLERKEARRMDPFCHFALAGAELAMKESQMPIGLEKPNGYNPEMVGVIVGSGIGGLQSFEESFGTGLNKGFDRLSPFFILKMISNMAPGRISMRYNCKGANWGPVSACSTSAHAIGEAWRQIRWGELDAAIAGGAEAAITPMGIAIAWITRDKARPAEAQARLLAAEVDRDWRLTTPQPLRYVGGEAELAFGVVTWSADRPRALTEMPAPPADELRHAGMAIVCFAEDAGCKQSAVGLAGGAPNRVVESTIVRGFWGKLGAPQGYTIVLVPPRR